MWEEEEEFLFDMYLLDMWEMEEQKEKIKKSQRAVDKAGKNMLKMERQNRRMGGSDSEVQKSSGVLAAVLVVFAAVASFAIYFFEIAEVAISFAWENFLCWSWQYVVVGLIVFVVVIMMIDWKN